MESRSGCVWLRDMCEPVTCVALLTLASPLRAQDIGFEGPRFSPTSATPTESKPENKLWFNDGSWWASMWSTAASAYTIHRLDFGTHSWIDTGVEIDSRSTSRGDALWDGTHAYVASHVFTTSGGSSGNPLRLYRFSYEPTTDTFALDPGFPVAIGDSSTESASIEKDSTGRLWAVWTQGSRVRMTHSLATDLQWSTPVVLPANTSNLTTDD